MVCREIAQHQESSHALVEGASVSSLEGQAEEPEIKLPAFVGSWRKHGTSRKNFCSIDYTKAFDCINHNKVWEILKEMGISDHLTCPLRNLYVGQEKTVRTTGSKLEKKYDKAVYCHPAYLFFELFILYWDIAN